MAISEDLLIIIVVVALVVALVLCIIMAVYFCYCRPRMHRQATGQPKQMRNHHLPRHDVNDSPGQVPAKVALDKLPNAAQTKRMEAGQSFEHSADNQINGQAEVPEDDAIFVMGPSADLAERQPAGHENAGFSRENQVESGAYLRGGIDPADVAEIYMQDDMLKEAARARRRQEQVEVRRQQTKNRVAAGNKVRSGNSSSKSGSSQKSIHSSSTKDNHRNSSGDIEKNKRSSRT